MPTPVAFTSGEHSPFTASPSLEKSNLVDIFYATNRAPLGPRGARIYTIFPGQTLYLGRARVRIGARDKPWEELYALSTTDHRSRRPMLRLDTLDELAVIPYPQTSQQLGGEAHEFFAAIDRALARGLDKDLTIYVHGVNTNVATAAAQAAQYRHFTGRDSVVLLFAWPSAERGIRYFTDVRNARASVLPFARLLNLLAGHTTAEHINVVAYSGGSQILSPALLELRRLRGREGLAGARLGEVYFAAPDLALPTFVRQLPHYIHDVRRVTVSVNMNDAPLTLSSWVHGVSRLGRPDPTEISETDWEWLVEAAERLDFDIVSADPRVIPGLSRRAHAFWYDHPWVSSDVVLKMRFHVPPAARGLERQIYQGRFPFWTFPRDYDQRVVAILGELWSQQRPLPVRSLGSLGVPQPEPVPVPAGQRP